MVEGEPGESRVFPIIEENFEIEAPMGSNLMKVLETLLDIPRRIQMLIME